MVTPEQIELSRRIQQFFTGDLEASVIFESAFPGVEKHLLRAQIQRISAGTQVCSFSFLLFNLFPSYRLVRKIILKLVTEDEQMGEETIDCKIDKHR